MRNIYLAQQTGTTLYKIGITKNNPADRIKQLQTGNANEIILLESFQTNYGYQTEAAVHAHYKMKKVSSEWFELDEDDLKIFYSVCERIEHAFKVLEQNTYLTKINL